MSYLIVADAAQAREDIALAYPEVDGVAMYCGGDTPHVASLTEWHRQSARYRVPIYTRSNPAGHAQANSDAEAFVKALKEIKAPVGRLVMLDFEQAVDGAYVQQFDTRMRAAGYPVALYGARSYVHQNPSPKAPGGYWGAQWNNVPHVNDDEIATQYASSTMTHGDYDLSAVREELPLWDTRPDEPGNDDDEEDDMNFASDERGRAGVSWGTGSRHVVQAVYDKGPYEDPKVRVVLALETGPWVDPQPWQLEKGNSVYELPSEHIATCRGVTLSSDQGDTVTVYYTAV